MNNTTTISCNLVGGLGNQLFQVATTLAHAIDNNYQVVFEKKTESPSVFKPRPTYWDSYFHNCKLVKKSQLESFTIFKEKAFSYNNLPPFNSSTLLEGYFQSAKYFHHHKNKILNILKLSNSMITKINNDFSEFFAIPNKLSLHIRRGDYLKLKKYHLVLSQTDYYQKAIEKFSDTTNIIIFSDDINWCRKNIKKCLTPYPSRLLNCLVNKNTKKFNFHFIESDEVTELYLMSQCHHHIIANSSFSWWGAYMSPNKGRVIAPEKWFGKKCNIENHHDLYLNHWEKIE